MSGKRKLSIGIISSYPPKKCGVADFIFFGKELQKNYFKVIQEWLS